MASEALTGYASLASGTAATREEGAAMAEGSDILYPGPPVKSDPAPHPKMTGHGDPRVSLLPLGFLRLHQLSHPQQVIES